MIGKNLWKIVLIMASLAFVHHSAEGQGMNPDSIVWPGDINNNGVVNHYDLLFLGAAYNAQGAPRPSQSLAWEGQDVAPNWAPGFFEGNLTNGFADCNGDGLVNDMDIQAIEVNYGLNHDSVFPDTFNMQNGIADSEILFDTVGNPIQISGGQTIVVPINLGTDNLVIEDFYGVAFTITIDTEYIDLSSVGFEIDPTWIGAGNDELISIQKNNFNNNTIDIALSRRTMNTTFGNGRIGSLFFVIEDNVPDFAPDTEVMRIENTVVVNNELKQTYYISDASLNLDFTNPTIELPKTDFSIYPNPTNTGLCTIKGLENYPQAEFRLLDIVGREMQTEFTDENLSVGHLPSGIYFININTPKGRLTEKLIINN